MNHAEDVSLSGKYNFLNATNINLQNGYGMHAVYFPFNLNRTFRHTTLSGAPDGGKEIFFGGGPVRCDLLSNLHSPIFPYVSTP